jgi:hypothetical protein
MLSRASHRADHWPVAVKTHCCSIPELPQTEQFDVILACSVLHHIADLTTFLDQIRLHQSAGGLFIHLQDPNADYADDQHYLSRLTQCREQARQNRTPLIRKLTPRRVYRRIARALSERQNYIAEANRTLLHSGIITRKMAASDIWHVTDIRISPILNGVSLRSMRSLLAHYDLIASRSYAFFGEMGENLPAQFEAEEARLIEQHALNGHLVAAAWKQR